MNNNPRCRPFLYHALELLAKPSKLTLAAFLFLGLILVAGCAVYQGGTVTADVTPMRIHVEVAGKLR